MSKSFLAILFILTLSSLFFLPPLDPDFGWHYRCGKDLLVGKPCTENRYSYYLPEYRAYYTSFIYDVAISIVYDMLGMIGISLLGAIIMLLAGLMLARLVQYPILYLLALVAYIFHKLPSL